MERIELFDNFINNQLSNAQRLEFDERLKNDEEFAADFKIYLLTVNGICSEAHQNDIDFGLAIKKLTKEQLQEIIRPHNAIEREFAAAAERTGAADDHSFVTASACDADFSGLEMPKVCADYDIHLPEKKCAWIKLPEDSIEDSIMEIAGPKARRFKPWMWQAASIAAVVVIAFTAVFKIEQNSRNKVYDAIYACADINTDLARSGGETINIGSMSDDELKNEMPDLINLYKTASTTDEIADNGYTLAMVYLKLHERDKAAEVLNQLISRFEGNEDYADSVNKWKSILNLIK